MALYLPPWVLAPQFTWNTASFSGITNGIIARANSTRVALFFQAGGGPVSFGPGAGPNGDIRFNIDINNPNLEFTFDKYGGLVCTQWVATTAAIVRVLEVYWRPPAAEGKT